MSFQKGDIIVRDDGTYPEGALIVDGYDAQGNLLAHPLGGGFQFAIPSTDYSRFDAVHDAEKTPIFTRAKFALEGLQGSEFAEAQLLIAALGEEIGKFDQRSTHSSPGWTRVSRRLGLPKSSICPTEGP